MKTPDPTKAESSAPNKRNLIALRSIKQAIEVIALSLVLNVPVLALVWGVAR